MTESPVINVSTRDPVPAAPGTAPRDSTGVEGAAWAAGPDMTDNDRVPTTAAAMKGAKALLDMPM
ncbi:hypothetical protein ACFPK5_40210 [Streptomyces beijiangensis]|uniref:hypothetical protein n=1 Tax=Streptomyces beijiangensis TaxID=163361 RepID=UPI00361673E6